MPSELPIPPPRPTPLLLTGLMIDVAGRSLQIGSHTVEMLGTTSLDGLQAGNRGRRPCGTPVRRSASSATPSRRCVRSRTDASPARSRSPARPIVRRRCARRAVPHTRVLDSQLRPTADWYAIRIAAVKTTPDKAVLLPRRMLERALDDPAARRTVRDVLQVAVTVLHTQSSRRRRPAAAAPRPTSTTSSRGARPALRRCEGPLSSDDPIVAEAGAHGHLACPPYLVAGTPGPPAPLTPSGQRHPRRTQPGESR